MTSEMEQTERALALIAQSLCSLSPCEKERSIVVDILYPDMQVLLYAMQYGRSSIPGIYHLTFCSGLVTFSVHHALSPQRK